MSQVGMAKTVISTKIVEAVNKDEKNESCDISAGMFGQEMSQVMLGLAQDQAELSKLSSLNKKLKGIVELAGEWCADQENGMTDGEVCISALKDIRRLLNEP